MKNASRLLDITTGPSMKVDWGTCQLVGTERPTSTSTVAVQAPSTSTHVHKHRGTQVQPSTTTLPKTSTCCTLPRNSVHQVYIASTNNWTNFGHNSLTLHYRLLVCDEIEQMQGWEDLLLLAICCPKFFNVLWYFFPICSPILVNAREPFPLANNSNCCSQ